MQNTPQTYGSRTMDMSVDQGLRSYMLGIYNYMTLGVALTGVTAWLVAMFSLTTDASLGVDTLGNGKMLTQFGHTLFVSPLKYLFIFSPLAFVLALSFGINRMSVTTVQALFWAFAAVMGLSMGSIFLVYTLNSVTQVFFITAATFAGLSLYGYTTKRDLSGFGSFLIMGVWGLMLAMIVNMFLQSSAMSYVISAIGVLVFAGLTAYDTQRLKESYYDNTGAEMTAKMSVMGALSLYLDFINMFQFLLMLMGRRD